MKAKESVDTMLAASARPQNTKSDGVILQSGNRRHIPVNPTGERTKLGEYYEQKAMLSCLLEVLVQHKPRFVKAMLNTSKCEMARSGLSDVMTPRITSKNLQSSVKASTPVSREITLCKSLLR